MPSNGQNVFEMLRRGDAVVEAIHWAGFAAVGATWEPVEDVFHRNKGLVLTHGRAAPVELGKYVRRAKTLHSLSGRKQMQETAHYTCALDNQSIKGPHRATHGPRRSHIPAPPHGGQTLHHEVMQAWGAVSESRQH